VRALIAHDGDRRGVGGEGERRLAKHADARLGPCDEHRDREMLVRLGGQPADVDEPHRVGEPVDAAEAVEDGARRRRRDVADGAQPTAHDARDLRPDDDVEVAGVAHGTHRERGCRADGELELGIGLVLGVVEPQDDRHAGAPRLLVLTHHESTGLGGRLPVH
jgi:hypothetical protein